LYRGDTWDDAQPVRHRHSEVAIMVWLSQKPLHVRGSRHAQHNIGDEFPPATVLVCEGVVGLRNVSCVQPDTVVNQKIELLERIWSGQVFDAMGSPRWKSSPDASGFRETWIRDPERRANPSRTLETESDGTKVRAWRIIAKKRCCNQQPALGHTWTISSWVSERTDSDLL